MKKKEKKKDMQNTKVMLPILANTMQLDNTQTHVDMQTNHQNKIEKMVDRSPSVWVWGLKVQILFFAS